MNTTTSTSRRWRIARWFLITATIPGICLLAVYTLFEASSGWKTGPSGAIYFDWLGYLMKCSANAAPGVLTLLACCLALRLQRRRPILLCFAFIFAVIVCGAALCSAHDPFVVAARGIRPGMTIAEAESAMKPRPQAKLARPVSPQGDGSVVYTPMPGKGEGSGFNYCGVVFERGKVKSVYLNPD